MAPTEDPELDAPQTDGEENLDEEVAALMVEGFGGVLTRLTNEQAKYIHVNVDGPYKTDSYKY